MGMFMGFSPVECVVSYVGMADRYTLKNSYVWLPLQDSNSFVHCHPPLARPHLHGLSWTHESHLAKNMPICHCNESMS